MNKLLLALLLLFFPVLGFANSVGGDHPDFVITRQEWGADESLRLRRTNNSNFSQVRKDPKEEEFLKKYSDQMKVSKVVDTDNSGNKLHWPISYSDNVEAFVVHHSATDLPFGREKEALQSIYYWHSVVRGWGDIGYNYIIDNNGNIYEGRAGGLYAIGGHANLYNNGTVGIMLLGNFNDTVPTAPSLVALKKLLKELAVIYNVDLESTISFRDKENIPSIVGHSELMNTACPGYNFFNYLAFWRENEDFSGTNAVASIANTGIKKDYLQFPSGSSLNIASLGIGNPKRIVEIDNGQIDIKDYRGTINFPEKDGILLLSYSDVGGRGDQSILEFREDFYGIELSNLPDIVSVEPSQVKRISVVAKNSSGLDLSLNSLVETEGKYKVFPNISTNGGSVRLISGKDIRSNNSRTSILEIVAPMEDGIYESRLVYDIGNGNIIGGKMLPLRVKVGAGLAQKNNDLYRIESDDFNFKISLDRVVNSQKVDLDFSPNISKEKWDKYVKESRGEILGKNIPSGIKTFFRFENKPEMTISVQSNVSPGNYRFFTFIDSEDGVFGSKGIEIDLEVEALRPWLEINEYDKNTLQVTSESESFIRVLNSGNVDFLPGEIFAYSSKSKECYADPTRELIGKNASTIFKGRDSLIKLNYTSPEFVSFNYVCLDVPKYELYPGQRRVILKPFQAKLQSEINQSRSEIITDKISEPEVRILLRSVKDAQVLSFKSDKFDVYDSKLVGTIDEIDSVNVGIGPGESMVVSTFNGDYFSNVKKVVIYPKGNLVTINNWFRSHSWDTNNSYPDNQFRGKIEVYNGGDQLYLVNVVTLEDYLYGLGEVSVNDHLEKMKAIAIVARSYAYHYSEPENRKFNQENAPRDKFSDVIPVDGSDDPAEFQRYLGRGIEDRMNQFVFAVRETKGEMLVWEGKIIKPPYFSSSDGRTRSALEVWGWRDTPYLKVKSDPWCEGRELNGHGVGMSGCGAQGQAEEGKTYKEILEYYYPGVKLVKFY